MNAPRKPQRGATRRKSGQHMTRQERLYCTNCSLPRRVIHFDGEVWTCTHCGRWWNQDTPDDPVYAPLFRQGGPAGFDPETGFECQAHPRKSAP